MRRERIGAVAVGLLLIGSVVVLSAALIVLSIAALT